MLRASIKTLAFLSACAASSAIIPGIAAQTPDQPKSTSPAPPQVQAPVKNDYGNGDNWVCRPGRQDSCTLDMTTTIVSPDGKATTENWTANPNAPIDCFY